MVFIGLLVGKPGYKGGLETGDLETVKVELDGMDDVEDRTNVWTDRATTASIETV